MKSLRARHLAALVLGLTGCPEETLQGLPARPLSQGGVRGRICDRSSGAWVGGAAVSVQGKPEITTVTGEDGSFEVAGLPPGEYIFEIDADGYHGLRVAEVGDGAVTDIGVTECRAETGSVEGRVCDDARGVWLEGATATITTPIGTATAVSDSHGRFELTSVPIGPRDIVVTKDDLVKTFPVVVASSISVRAGDTTCGPTGGLHGRICGTTGMWLVNATISITTADGEVFSTTSDANGYYTLLDVPVGTYEVTARRGAFVSTFSATISGGVIDELPEPVCISGGTRLAVVTGSYDQVEHVLADLGFGVRATYPGDGADPTITSPEGTLDVFNGFGSWVDDLLLDPTFLAGYDIVFFNCGLWTSDLEASASAIENLETFVDQGGSVYASDWGGEVLNLVFPSRVNFLGPVADFSEAQVGEDGGEAGDIVDADLSLALARDSISINFDYGMWVVLEPLAQQPQDLRVWVVADVATWSGPVQTSPLLVQFAHGQGRVLFTAFHNESQVTQDMEDVLNYIVFEL